MDNIDRIRINFQPKRLTEDLRALDLALEKSRQATDSYRPDPNNFIDESTPGYTANEIQRDLREVKLLKEVFEDADNEHQTMKKIATVYEAVLIDQIEQNAWLGNDWNVFPASEYDDFKNGIDAVMVHTEAEKGKHLGLSFDVTFTSNTRVLEKKLNSIKEVIRAKKLPQVKYFVDEDGEPLREALMLPKVVLGSRYASAEKIIRTWMGSGKERNQKLASDPIQTKLLMETLYQLRYFYKFASQPGEHEGEVRNEEAAQLYGEMYNLLFDVYTERAEMIQSHANEVSDDVVFDYIRSYTGN